MKLAQAFALFPLLAVPVTTMASTLGQGTTLAGAVFVNACAGSQAFGSSPWAGDAFNGGATDSFVNCSSASSVVGGSASVSASNSGSYFGHGFNNDASASAAPGILHAGANNNASNASQFAGAAANVGFNDTLTVGGGSGTGVLILPFFVDGSLSAGGFSGGADLTITAYKNFNQIDAYGANTAAYNLFNSLNTTHNGDVFSSWDREAIEWGTSANDINSMLIGQWVDMAIPITFGQSFEYGIYAEVYMTQSSGSYFGPTTQNANFLHTIAYGAGSYVMQGANKITDLNFSGTSAGIDYTQSLVGIPEPASLLLCLLGAGALAVRYRPARR